MREEKGKKEGRLRGNGRRKKKKRKGRKGEEKSGIKGIGERGNRK